ncbi:MAG: Uncharacterised protein [Halieaceae bacterium]|nr:MAG: Uncharacterised protein [Halieaceae bacterium]
MSSKKTPRSAYLTDSIITTLPASLSIVTRLFVRFGWTGSKKILKVQIFDLRDHFGRVNSTVVNNGAHRQYSIGSQLKRRFTF